MSLRLWRSCLSSIGDGAQRLFIREQITFLYERKQVCRGEQEFPGIMCKKGYYSYRIKE